MFEISRPGQKSLVCQPHTPHGVVDIVEESIYNGKIYIEKSYLPTPSPLPRVMWGLISPENVL